MSARVKESQCKRYVALPLTPGPVCPPHRGRKKPGETRGEAAASSGGRGLRVGRRRPGKRPARGPAIECESESSSASAIGPPSGRRNSGVIEMRPSSRFLCSYAEGLN